MKIIVFHTSYGCETGCCGHAIEIDGEEKLGSFDFSHPYGDDHLVYAQRLVANEMGEQHIADLDWENSIVVDD